MKDGFGEIPQIRPFNSFLVHERQIHTLDKISSFSYVGPPFLCLYLWKILSPLKSK
jgi:hypothetical protein